MIQNTTFNVSDFLNGRNIDSVTDKEIEEMINAALYECQTLVHIEPKALKG